MWQAANIVGVHKVDTMNSDGPTALHYFCTLNVLDQFLASQQTPKGMKAGVLVLSPILQANRSRAYWVIMAKK